MNANQYMTPLDHAGNAGQPRVLIVDDEKRYIRLIEINLQASDYETLTARNADEALTIAAREELDLILLDIMLPDKIGYEVCEEIREFSQVPIIMLTALGQAEDIVKGLDAGADDYIPKPFSAQELLARIRAVLRRSSSQATDSSRIIRAGDVKIDLEQRRVFRNSNEMHLTSTEYKLLVELIQNAGKVMVPDYLLEAVWGYQYEAQPQILWQAIHRLRQKLEPDPSNPTYIHTRQGIGYLFSAESSDKQGERES